MNRNYSSILIFAVALCTPVFAQHGHAGGGMGMGSSHANSNAGTSATSGNRASTANGQTMTQILSRNTNLANKITKLTGASSAETACSGFRNLGQCVAAAHVSKNLGISFGCLKSNTTGTAAPAGSNCAATKTSTGASTKAMSLGSAIQALSPGTNSKSEAKKGQQQANQDLKDAANS